MPNPIPFSPSSLVAALPGATTSSRAPSQAPRVAHAAKEFESMLLSQWLQDAEKSFATVPGSEDSDDPGSEQMQGFAMQQLGTALTASGGIGIAKLVSRALDHTKDASSAYRQIQDAKAR